MLAFGVSGLASGGSFALLGLTLTIIFQTTRTVNFAVAGNGAFGAFVLAALAEHGVPYGVGLIAGMATGAAISVALGGVLVWWFDDADVQVRSVITIAELISMLALSSLIFGGHAQAVPTKFTTIVVTIQGATIVASTLVIIALAVVLAAVVSVLLSRTTVGTRLRAVSDRPVTAELLGIPARSYGLWAWAVTGAISVPAVTLVASTQSTDFPTLSLLVVPALAAALAGLFRSLLWTVVGGLVLGVLQGVMAGWSALADYSSTAPFFALLLLLIYTQRHERWEDAR